MSSSRSRSRHERQLVCSGQDSVDADGNPQHPGDMAAQIELSLDNLEAVPAAAEMTLADVVRLNVYTTDVDELFEQWGRLAERLGTPAAASRRRCSALPDSQHHSSSSS
jgi:enamine deaminase RidA (YjgF/YER057c/UK114 family)